MAASDAEAAFLQAMQVVGDEDSLAGARDDPALEDDGEEEEEDYDPSNLNYEPSVTLMPTATDRLASPSGLSAQDSLIITTIPGPTETPLPSLTSPSARQQPRKLAGFILDDADEDGDEASLQPPSRSGSVGSLSRAGGSLSSPGRSLPPTVFSPRPDISLHSSVQDRAGSADASNSVNDPTVSLAAVTATTATTIPSTSAAIIPVSHRPSAPTNGFGSRSSVQALSPSQASPTTALPTPLTTGQSRARLPHDKVGILEDRIADDPKGDWDAWLTLISEHRKRNKIEDARSVYERFFKVFPSAAEQWVTYATMELQSDDFYRVEQIFNRSLLSIPNVQLWSIYLDYVRRRNNLITDTTGNARQVVSQAYDFVLQNIGIDKDSGQIWQDYIDFLRSGPGIVGGTGWQDQQKMDLLRKAYQKAICVPTQAVNALWKEYDQFEMGLNRVTGRKFLQEKSPSFMTARSSLTALQNLTRDLHRTSMPKLPPGPGFEGEAEYLRQVEVWNKWVEWEKDDPLVLKGEDFSAFTARVVYVYKQAVMALRFWPETWYNAAEFCFQNGLESEGDEFLSQAVIANPESCLLAFRQADHAERTSTSDETAENLQRRGGAVRAPFDRVLTALYDLLEQNKNRELRQIADLELSMQQSRLSPANSIDEAGDEERADENVNDRAGGAIKGKETALRSQMEEIQTGNAAQTKVISKTISFAWVALMRAMRRVQGKGKVGDVVGGSRQIFADARKRGRITSDVYIASALIEYHCYKDPAATKIFERGMKIFEDDENFALEYLKHLIAINDITNARAVFETTVSRLSQRPETLGKCKPIYAFFHEYESHYGELSQVAKLEKRMTDLFPGEESISTFAHRHSARGFDPTSVRPIVSPATQARPKGLPIIASALSPTHSPRPNTVSITRSINSPKRPFNQDDSDSELAPHQQSLQPRKLPRGESPLRGAAGRRVIDAKRFQQREGMPAANNGNAGAAVAELPREVMFLLSIIPRADTYRSSVFNPQRMVQLLRSTEMSRIPAAVSMQASGTYQYGR